MVWEWLHSAGIHRSSTTDFGDAIDISTSVKHAEQLFNTKMHVYKHTESGAQIVRHWGRYGVPDNVAPLVDMVLSVSTFPVPRRTIRRPCGINNYGIVPQSLDSMYQISDAARASLSASAANVTQGVIEFDGQNYSPADLEAYAKGTGIPIPLLDNSTIIGPNRPQWAEEEAQLDIQLMAGVSRHATNWFWLESPPEAWIYRFAVHFAATENVPQVASISYAWYESQFPHQPQITSRIDQ